MRVAHLGTQEALVSAHPVLTGIGSFPPAGDSVDASLRAAVDLQRAHGFALFTDGEPRGDMLSYYVGLPGIEEHAGAPRVVGRIQPLDDPATFSKVRDLDFLRREFPGLPFKLTLTGPATFLLACAARGAGAAYRGPLDPALHDDLTNALRPIAREIARRDAHLQIDDPILSQGMRDYGPTLQRIDAIASEVPRDRMSVHVCGGLVRSKALDALQRLENVSALSLAFAGRSERENLDLLNAKTWEERDLDLGVGAVDVQVATRKDVMTPQSVADLLRTVASRIPEDRLRFVLPSCGLRGTSRELVPLLLESLQKGQALAFPELREARTHIG